MNLPRNQNMQHIPMTWTPYIKSTKELCNKKRQSTTGVRDKECKLIMEKDKILQRWKEHFDQLLNIETKIEGNNLDHEFDKNVAEAIEEINTGPSTAEEVKHSIGKLKKW
jgi:hypothetical protein